MATLSRMWILAVAIALLSVTATLSCPPGFVSQGNSCVCADWPDGTITCDEDSLNASIRIGYCMTYDNETDEVRAGVFQPNYLRNNSYKFYYSLPSELSALNDEMCGPFNREGLLCGECQEGFAVPLFNFLDEGCINCTGVSYGWLKLIAFAYVPITVIFIVVVVFSISVVSGPVNSFILFAQLSASTFIDMGTLMSVLASQGTFSYSKRISTVVVDGIYDMFNLKFFHTFIPPFCLTSHLSTVQALALQYVIAFYPLVAITFLYVCIRLHAGNFRPVVYCWKPFLKCFLRFRRRVDPTASVINVFSTFILLSYVRLVYVVGRFLTPLNLFNSQGQMVNTSVFAFDATIQFFHAQHLPFAVLSIFVLLTFIAIPPIVLTFYQAAFFQKCLTQCKMNSQGLRTFVEAFQGCYKDGTNGTRDCRYFAGLYFIFRLIVVLPQLNDGLGLGNTYKYITTSFAIFFWCIALFFALAQPYKIHLYNVVDAVIFALSGTITVLVLFIDMQVQITGHPSSSFLILTDVLYTLPLLYLVLFIVCWLLNKKTNCIHRLKSHKLLRCLFRDQGVSQREDFDAAIPHRVLYPEQYQ